MGAGPSGKGPLVTLTHCMQSVKKKELGVPNGFMVFYMIWTLVFVEPPAPTQTPEATFEVIYQGSRGVGLLSCGRKTGAEVDIMINW